jgi:hypothetical protein
VEVEGASVEGRGLGVDGRNDRAVVLSQSSAACTERMEPSFLHDGECGSALVHVCACWSRSF